MRVVAEARNSLASSDPLDEIGHFPVFFPIDEEVLGICT